MIKTGYEIIGMIKNGEAPRKIKYDDEIWEFNEFHSNYSCKSETLNLIKCLNYEFEIIENNKVWKPKLNEEYYIVSARGNVIESERFEGICSDYAFKSYWELGNCFKTKEEAQKMLEKAKIYAKLKKYAEEYNSEKIDWNNENQKKWCIIYEFEDESFVTVEMGTMGDIGQIYFTSEEIAEEAIQEIGEENIEKLFN